jgi:hypothetical protein
MTCRSAAWAAAGLIVLGIGVAAEAEAAAITCPNPVFNYGNNNQHTSNTYTVAPAIDCVWAPDASNNIGQAGDDFILGLGINDPAYGNTGPTFGLTWTFIGGTGGVKNAQLTSITGLTFTNFTGASAHWVLDLVALNLAYGTSFNTFALGLKDGSEPQWAVFLLDTNQLGGTVSMTGGSFSHFVAYGATAAHDVPEPSVLLLLGAGGLVAPWLRKRRPHRRNALRLT